MDLDTLIEFEEWLKSIPIYIFLYIYLCSFYSTDKIPFIRMVSKDGVLEMDTLIEFEESSNQYQFIYFSISLPLLQYL